MNGPCALPFSEPSSPPAPCSPPSAAVEVEASANRRTFGRRGRSSSICTGCSRRTRRTTRRTTESVRAFGRPGSTFGRQRGGLDSATGPRKRSARCVGPATNALWARLARSPASGDRSSGRAARLSSGSRTAAPLPPSSPRTASSGLAGLPRCTASLRARCTLNRARGRRFSSSRAEARRGKARSSRRPPRSSRRSDGRTRRRSTTDRTR